VKIFFFTTVFAPSVGGIERLVETLCAEFVANGHEVRLATMTPGDATFSYPVIRRPNPFDFLRLLQWCDVHIQSNVALKYAWPRFVAPQKFVYQHNNAYQRDNGTRGVLDHLKAVLARQTTGIANSHFTSVRTGADHVVFNAYGDSIFRNERPWSEREGELVFLGRLVSQKGCDTLLQALARLACEGMTPRLTVIGDGPDRQGLEALCVKLGLNEQTRFIGPLQGRELARMLNDHRVIVVPSRYEEPFGIVALEGMACGCIPVVSERGGLVDAIGGHGFTFANGGHGELAELLCTILSAPEAAYAKLNNIESHLVNYTASNVANQYLEIFRHYRGFAS
jgi:glycogen(starch) synthase